MADLLDPDDVAALLAVPPEEFVAARTARVKELKTDGHKDEAAALARLRKPVRLVWVVGELARRHPDVAGAAAEVAEELEEAQASGSGVRPLLKRFRDVVGQVAELADEVEGTVDRLEVGLALREVLADPGGREAWIEGRLLALPGDEDDEAPADELAPRRAAKKAAARKGAAKDGPDDEAEQRAREEAEARRVAEEAVAATEAEVAEATTARDGAASALADLEEQLAALEARVAEARASVEEADTAVAAAQERHATATTALDDLG